MAGRGSAFDSRSVSVEWSADADGTVGGVSPELAARAVVAVLLGQPQPAVRPVEALRCHAPTTGWAQGDEPLTYVELGERLAVTGVRRPVPNRVIDRHPMPVTAFDELIRAKKAERKEARLAQPGHAISSRKPTMTRTRPGEGGRQPRITTNTASIAVASLVEELGPPTLHERIDSAEIHHWRRDYGTGFALARLSAQDMYQGEQAFSQVHAMEHMRSLLNLDEFRHIVVATECSGARPFGARPDLMILRQAIKDGEITFLTARDTDRLTRDERTRIDLLEMLRDTGIDLYLCAWQGYVDLERDDLQIRLRSIIDDHERTQIYIRTQTGLLRRFVAEGNGFPGALPFGFVWDRERRRWRVDEVQWPFVQAIHYAYHDDHTRTLRRIHDDLKAQGCTFAVETVRRILKNPIYVTGEYTVGWRNVRVTAKPVEIPNPIPLNIYQANMERLSLRQARTGRIPENYFVLNNVKFLHAACMHTLVDTTNDARIDGTVQQTTPTLHGRQQHKGRFLTYAHYPRCPKGCWGYTIKPEIIEPIVMRELRRLAANTALQAEWKTKRVTEPAARRETLDRAARTQLERDLATLDTQIAEYDRRRVTEGTAEHALDVMGWTNLTRPLAERREQIKRQLERDGLIAAIPEPPRIQQHHQRIAAAAGLNDDALYAELAEALEEVLTDEYPADEPDLARRRAAVVQACLSSVIITDVPGGVTIRLEGPLVPPNAPTTNIIGPIRDARTILEAHKHATTDDTLGTTIEPSNMSPRVGQFDNGAVEVIEYGDLMGLQTVRPELSVGRRPRRAATSVRRVDRLPGADWIPDWVSPELLLELPFCELQKGWPRAQAGLRMAVLVCPEGVELTRTVYERLRREVGGLPQSRVVRKALLERGLEWAAGVELIRQAVAAERES